MLGRWIKRLILLTSFAAASALILLPWCIGSRDWLIARAQQGMYQELRLTCDGMVLSTFSVWPIDEKLSFGRSGDRDSLALPLPGFRFNKPVLLLDGTVLQLRPAGAAVVRRGTVTRKLKQPWYESGFAAMPAPPAKYNPPRLPATTTFSPTLPPGSTIVSSTRQSFPLTPNASVSHSAPTLTLDDPLRVVIGPSLTRPDRSAETKDDALGAFKQSMALSIAPTARAKPNPQPALAGLSFGGGFSRATPSYAYESTMAPYWAAAMIVLTPVWIAILVAVLRWKKQRVRRARGLCMRCGYDLRASPTQCPECGEMAAGGAIA